MNNAMTTAADAMVSEKTASIRARARERIARRAGREPEPRTTCPICGGAADLPYRRYAGAEVVEGCVDAFHSEEMAEAPGTATAAWHFRPAARTVRMMILATLERFS